MIDLTKAKEGNMFAQTFVADPEHDHFVGPQVPDGEAWGLTTLWMRAGKGGLGEAMLGILEGERFVALASRRSLLEGDSLTWSGDVLMTAGMAILFWTQLARQEEDVSCSATWKVLTTDEMALVELKEKWKAALAGVREEQARSAATTGDGDGARAAEPDQGPGKPKPRRKGRPPDEGQAAQDS